MFKSTISLFVIALALTAACETTRNERTLEGDAKSAVAQLTGIVMKEIARATATIKATHEELKVFGKTSETTVLSLLQTTVNTNLKEIKDAELNAAAHGFDASACINGQDLEMQATVSTVNNQMTQLVEGNLTEANKVATTATNNVQGMSKSVQKLQTKLTGCAVGIPGLVCYTEVLTEASKLSGDIPKKIVNLEDKAYTDLGAINAAIIDSTYVFINLVQMDISNATQNITQCINELQLGTGTRYHEIRY